MEEKDLIVQAGQGDEAAFSSLVQRHLEPVYRQILSAVGDRDTAFDLTRETFLRAWHAISLFQFDMPLSQWLRDLAEDVLQSRRKQPVPAGLSQDTTVPETLHSAIVSSIHRETGSGFPALLKRFRFTMIALVIVAVLLLVSRLSGGQSAPAPSPVPPPSQSPAADVDTASVPGI